jgi:hypothetical protein
VVSLNATISGLVGREQQYEQELDALRRQLAESRQRRDRLAAEVRASLTAPEPAVQLPAWLVTPPVDAAPADAASASAAAGAPGATPLPPAPPTSPGPPTSPPPTSPAPPYAAPAAGRPAAEVSGFGVQTLLFVVGGLLLGTGAVVFMIVAWTRFGMLGQAGTLVAATAVALSAPVLARSRRLPGTAETLAVIGVLLVLLDGYAAWRAGLVDQLPGATWAGLVAGGTALISLGYARWTGLASPRYAALVLAQPVVPLLALEPARQLPELIHWLVLAGYLLALVAGGNLGLCWWLRGAARHRRALRIVGWVAVAGWLAAGGAAALAAVVAAPGPGLSALAGGALLVGVAVLALLARVAGSGGWASAAAAVAVLALALAGGRLVALSWPGYALVGVAAVVGAVAIAGPVCRDGPVWRGRRAGALVAVGAVGAVATGLTLWAAVVVAWLAPAEPAALEVSGPFDWQLPAALGLLAAALAVLLPGRRAQVAAVGLALVALALPAALGWPWWTPVAVGLTAAAILAGLAAPAARGRAAVTGTVAAAGLVVHALLVGLATAASTAAVLGSLVALGLAVAYRVRHSVAAGEPTAHRVIGRVALVVGLVSWPPAVAAALAAAGADAPWPGRFTLLAATALLGVVVVVRSRLPGYTAAAAAAVHVVTPVAVLAGLAEGGAADSIDLASAAVAGYAGTAVVVLALLGLVHPPAGHERWVAPRLPAAVLVLILAAPPLAAVLFGPYSWLASSWSGAPAGVGLLAGGGTVAASGHVTLGLLLLAVAAAVAGRVLAGRWRPGFVAGLLVGTAAGLVGLVGAGAPWPVVPAASLLLGVVAVLWAVLRGHGWPAAAGGGYGLLLAGAGLAGGLPTQWSTLAGLGLALVAAAVTAVAGRQVPVRVAGWLAAATSGVLLAVAATRALTVPTPVTGFAVLVVAAAVLAASATDRWPGATRAADPAAGPGRPERAAGEAAAHAAAVVALLLCLGSLGRAAAVAVLWGVALGLRALRRGEPATGRVGRAVAAAGCQLLAWWLLLAGWQVAAVEAYTVPAALVGLAAGALVRRHRPGLSSWVGYGPALVAGLLPTLALTVVDPAPVRRLLLGVAAVVVLVVGARWRLQAPAVIGGSLAALAALRELALVWQRLDAWIPLTVAGVLLVALAATYERRRRDLARLGAAVRRMA